LVAARCILLIAAASLASRADTTLRYSAEWRLVQAGEINLKWSPATTGASSGTAQMHVETSGLVARLYKVSNDYQVRMNEGYCAEESRMQIREGNRQRETTAKYLPAERKATYTERDLTKATTTEKSVEIPGCVHDVVGGLMSLRNKKLEPGQKLAVPISDGKKFAYVQVEAQEHETVVTPLGTFKTMRCEIFLMNDVIYGRKGRVFVWLTEDERHLPVQIRVRLQLLIGTITLQLTKEER
jgi:hypothetical protein